MADRNPVLIDRHGRPLRRADLRKEIAGPTITGVRSPFSAYPSEGLNPGRLAALLREADQGEPMRYFELAEQIEEKDPHYAGVLRTRKNSVCQLEITVEPASDDAAHMAHADMVREWLERDELADEMFDILDAIGKGVSYTEIIWDTSAGQWRPVRLEWRDPRHFRYDRNDGRTPLLRGDTGDEPLPPFKFIQAVMRAKSGLPVRSGLARLAAWGWMFKAFTQRDWAIFAQTFGQPIRVGKYHSSATPEDKETLYRAVANIAGDCAAIVPEGMAIEFVESRNVGQGSDLFEKRSDWLDRQISKAVLGQTATTDAIAGGHAVGKEHRLVQEDIERADARAIAAVLNRDLIRPWIDLDAGPQEKYPRLKIGRAEDKDVRLTLSGVRQLVPMGLRVKTSELYEKLGLSEPDESDDVLTPPERAAAPAPVLPGEQARETMARKDMPALPGEDEIAAGAAALTTQARAAMIAALREAVEGAQTIDELRARVAAMDLPGAELAKAMRQALVIAELSGRADLLGDSLDG